MGRYGAPRVLRYGSLALQLEKLMRRAAPVIPARRRAVKRRETRSLAYWAAPGARLAPATFSLEAPH